MLNPNDKLKFIGSYNSFWNSRWRATSSPPHDRRTDRTFPVFSFHTDSGRVPWWWRGSPAAKIKRREKIKTTNQMRARRVCGSPAQSASPHYSCRRAGLLIGHIPGWLERPDWSLCPQSWLGSPKVDYPSWSFWCFKLKLNKTVPSVRSLRKQGYLRPVSACSPVSGTVLRCIGCPCDSSNWLSTFSGRCKKR